MAGALETLRGAVETKINADKSGYTFATPTVDSQPIPVRKRISELTDNPRIGIIGLGWDHIRETRATARRDLTIQVTIQKKVKLDASGGADESDIDDVLELLEEVSDSLILVTSGRYFWSRTEQVTDPNGTPYDYDLYREKNVIQCMINAVYGG